MSLILYLSNDVKLPSGESVVSYVEELPARALQYLEEMTYEHERIAMDRYINMHNSYFAGTSSSLSSPSFATKSFIKKFADNYDEVEDLGDNSRMPRKISERILHFLFVYYFSYHEAEQEHKKRIDIQSFSYWFSKLRRKAGRKMMEDIKKKEKMYNSLTRREREIYMQRLKYGQKKWKSNWAHGSFETNLKAMKHVVYAPNFQHTPWRNAFKVSKTIPSEIHHEVLKKYRIWSRFLHPDKPNNKGLGLPFEHRLKERFLNLTEKKNEAVAWYEGLAIEVL